MPAKSFEDLFVFEKSREMVNVIYKISNFWKDYSLKDQIRRAAVSVLSNIAEGFERGTKQEFLHFLYIARGSCGEVRAQLYVALDQKYISKSQFEKAFDISDHVSRLLARFISGYKTKGKKGQKFAKEKNREIEEFEKELEKIRRKG